MKIILTENQFNNFILKKLNEEYNYDEKVEKIQSKLKDEYNLGRYGKKKDGVDGILGPLTKKAMEKEMEKNPSVKDEYSQLIKKHEKESDSEYDKKSKEYAEKPKPKSTSSDVIIFISGLHHRKNDLSVTQQKDKILQGMSKDKEIFEFSWRQSDEGLRKLDEYPNASVVLFSRGTGFAKKFAEKIENKDNLYIVEPYPKAKESIDNAITLGVPRENVILGGGTGSGLNLIPGGSRTPKEYAGHWPALEYIGTVIS